MSLSLYDISIPGFVRMLRNLAAFLDKAEAHAGAGTDALVEARLAPDMHPLKGQIQLASDAAKSAAARLAGQTPPSFPDDEVTYADLRARIAKTIAYLETLQPADIDGRENETVELKFPSMTLTFTGRDFLLQFAQPNFLFHVTTAYAILRAQGAPLGKMDFLAGGQPPPVSG